MADNYSTLRQGLYEALKTPLDNTGIPITPAQQKELKGIANKQADTIIEFLTRQTLTVTEFKAAVELDTLKNNSIDASIKMPFTFSMIGIYLTAIKMIFEPLNKIPITKPAYAAIIGIISQLEKAMQSLVPSNPGKDNVEVPVEVSKDETGLVAHGHAFVGAEASSIGPDGSKLANPEGNHTKVVLHKSKIANSEKKKLT